MDLLPSLLFEPVATGLAIAFVDRAARGRASWKSSVSHLVRTLPRLLALAALWEIVGMALSLLLLLPMLGEHAVVVTSPLIIALGYLSVRLLFVQVSVVVDDLDVRGAFERSWALTSEQWWRLAGLCVLTAFTAPPRSWFPPSSYVVVQALLAPVSTVVLVLAHRELAATRSLGRSIAGPPSPLGVLSA